MNTGYAERVAETFSHHPPQPFIYNSESKTFNVGADEITLEEYADFIAPPAEPISYEQATDLVAKSTLLLNVFDNHFQMPRMTDWIKSRTEKTWRDIQGDIAEIMIDAYAQVSGSDRKWLLKDTFMGFGVTLYRPGHPVFNVVGNCACYGVSPHGYIFDEHYWSSGFAEYETHNIDNQFQLVALHAGAGALAAMIEA